MGRIKSKMAISLNKLILKLRLSPLGKVEVYSLNPHPLSADSTFPLEKEEGKDWSKFCFLSLNGEVKMDAIWGLGILDAVSQLLFLTKSYLKYFERLSRINNIMPRKHNSIVIATHMPWMP